MSKPTDVRILEASCKFEPVRFRTPLKFGGRVVDKTVLMSVDVDVETRDGRQSSGIGSMPVGNIWAWPAGRVSPEQSAACMQKFLEEIVELANRCPDYGHPLELCYQISGEYLHLGKSLPARLGLDEAMPELAQLVAASPFDAAVHDAYGRALDVNSYHTLSEEFMNDDLSFYLDDQFQDEFLDRYVLPEPQKRMPLYHLVGALDPLTASEVQTPVKDGLPETLADWIAADGLTHLKIKLSGDDAEWDLQRVLAVEQVAIETQGKRGCKAWHYSLDFNEKCPSAEALVDFLKKLRSKSPSAYERVQYVEQPTSRDLESQRDQQLHRAAELKPIVVDEGLVDYEALLLAREIGYTGVALKACKGHTDSLLLAAAAQKFGMFLCVQDLTCPGYSFLHSASLAANIPGVAAIEGNGRQYCPEPNKPFRKRYPGMFVLQNGTVETGLLNGIGLGF